MRTSVHRTWRDFERARPLRLVVKRFEIWEQVLWPYGVRWWFEVLECSHSLPVLTPAIQGGFSKRRRCRECAEEKYFQINLMPQLKTLALNDIDEPVLPIRAAMDEAKLHELAESMAGIGLLQPIGVKPLGTACLHCGKEEKAHTSRVQCTYYMRYEIEFGHRRFLAAQSLNWKEIVAVVFQVGELAEGAAMLAENAEREDVTAAEEALLFAQAQERFSLDEDGLIKRFRRSAQYIGDRLALLRNDPQIFKALHQRQINFSVARELNKIADENMRRYYLDAAVRGGTNARTVASWRQQLIAQQVPATSASPLPVSAVDTPPEAGSSPTCFLCGGHKDPWNLESVYIHKHEREHILRMLEKAAEAS